MDKNFTGCLEDTRTADAKLKDWQKDVALSILIKWEEKEFGSFRTFGIRNQNGGGTCVMQTCDLICGIENFLEEGKFIEFSADLYNFRSNASAGMIGVNALELLKNKGLTLEVLLPSMEMNEAQIAELKRSVSDNEIAKIFRINDYWQLPFNVDAIASIMETGRKNGVAKPVMVWFAFPRTEWTSMPQIGTNNTDIVRHSVTAVEYGMMNGKKGLFIQDSWGLHNSTVNGLRFISEEYMKARMIFCAYVNDLNNDWQNKPEVVIERPVLRIGSKGDDVKKLQRLLVAGLEIDGDFGTKTYGAVTRFQWKNGLLQDGVVGRLTWQKLLE